MDLQQICTLIPIPFASTSSLLAAGVLLFFNQIGLLSNYMHGEFFWLKATKCCPFRINKTLKYS
jgi:hypothetical protein